MDWWARLIGGTAPKKQAPKSSANDPEARLARFKRVYHTVLALCNRPRDLEKEGPLLEQLYSCLERLDVLIREETRAPAPHSLLQFAATNKVYTVITRAALPTQNEPIIRATISVLAALIDSEEEDFLSSAPFAKSLMRLVRQALDSGTILLGIETETAVLELLFTISAKIRLQPEILSFWFQSTAKPELEDVFVKEKKSFVGITQKEDFPLCYLLIDRVHHEGRIGDFARTGLLYIFEATGRSLDLEEWVVSSDLPTLMASGLGALYSQLSRELSILHPDATLPAVLAMSDYSTTHSRVTAESAFSERHKSHMATFLSYLAFWQDVLDHCRSADVKQTLLDHFQILFLQQLLYPSLLQSSDTDAGSSVAVLTYMTAMLESLEYPDLMNMILQYLLAIQDDSSTTAGAPTTTANPPRSPTTVRRRQSLILLTAPKDPDDTVEPTLFNLVDLMLNNINSKNSQSVFAALKLASTLLTKQSRFALGTLLRVQKPRRTAIGRTIGGLELELETLSELATSLHEHFGLEDAYAGLTEDARLAVEAQVPFKPSTPKQGDGDRKELSGRYVLSVDDQFLKALRNLLRAFFTNSVDVNLALTHTLISIALCVEIRLDSWLTVDPPSYSFENEESVPLKTWQTYLEQDEKDAFCTLQQVSQRPTWSDEHAPLLYKTLQALVHELDNIRRTVPNLDHLIAGRKNMLQVTALDASIISSDPRSLMNSPAQATLLNVPKAPPPKERSSRGQSRSSSASSQGRGRDKSTTASPSQSASFASSPAPNGSSDPPDVESSSPAPPVKSLFLPPPPETPSTTDVLMQQISFPDIEEGTGLEDNEAGGGGDRRASLNHVLTNVVVLQEFVLELTAVLQVRAAVLGSKEVRLF